METHKNRPPRQKNTKRVQSQNSMQPVEVKAKAKAKPKRAGNVEKRDISSGSALNWQAKEKTIL